MPSASVEPDPSTVQLSAAQLLVKSAVGAVFVGFAVKLALASA